MIVIKKRYAKLLLGSLKRVEKKSSHEPKAHHVYNYQPAAVIIS